MEIQVLSYCRLWEWDGGEGGWKSKFYHAWGVWGVTDVTSPQAISAYFAYFVKLLPLS